MVRNTIPNPKTAEPGWRYFLLIIWTQQFTRSLIQIQQDKKIKKWNVSKGNKSFFADERSHGKTLNKANTGSLKWLLNHCGCKSQVSGGPGSLAVSLSFLEFSMTVQQQTSSRKAQRTVQYSRERQCLSTEASGEHGLPGMECGGLWHGRRKSNPVLRE